jgi:hypothetical protein
VKSRDFCFWLQGHFELNGTAPISAEKAAVIHSHLSLVFKHEIDPSAGSAAHQAELNEIHHGESVAGDMDAVAGASTVDPMMPPHIALKFQELKEEMDKKLEELRRETGWRHGRPGPNGGMMRC